MSDIQNRPKTDWKQRFFHSIVFCEETVFPALSAHPDLRYNMRQSLCLYYEIFVL
jgi:hypothetical protein